MIIGITGKKKSGKDTLFSMFAGVSADFNRFAFGDDLKAEVAYACGVTVKFINDNKDVFRPVLQWWGTDFRRNCCGKDYWVAKMRDQLSFPSINASRIPVITDVRFINEAAFVKSMGGVMVRVVGGKSEDGDEHLSECEMDSIPVEYVIDNHYGLEMLAASAMTLLKDLQDKRLLGGINMPDATLFDAAGTR